MPAWIVGTFGAMYLLATIELIAGVAYLSRPLGWPNNTQTRQQSF